MKTSQYGVGIYLAIPGDTEDSLIFEPYITTKTIDEAIKELMKLKE